MRKSELIQVERTKKDRGRLKITLIVVKNDMLIKKVTKNITLDRIKWWKQIGCCCCYGDIIGLWIQSAKLHQTP